MITILGATATGKTKLAAKLALKINGEIISADSRQIYRGMDIGTGKDLKDYYINNNFINHHLIDIKDPGYEYNLFEFQTDFLSVYKDIIYRKKTPVLCGGTGLYLDAVIRKYNLQEVPPNENIRQALSSLSQQELIEKLKSYKTVHNTSDSTDKERTLRAIEIAEYRLQHPIPSAFPEIKNIVFGMSLEREQLREKIRLRLKQRLEDGLIEEIRTLLNSGLTPKNLMFYGLEYKFVTQYVIGVIDYNTLFETLYVAICQFAKRQSTWFRRMERNGVKICWLDARKDSEELVNEILNLTQSH